MDALADVLKTIRLNTSTYFCSDFSSPWGMEVTKGDEGLFHVVISGECWLRVYPQTEAIHLKMGDIVAFPSGGAHSISDQQDSNMLPGKSVVSQIQAGNNPFHITSNTGNSGTINNTLLCGAFSYDTSVKHPFIRDLPCFIHIKAAQSDKTTWLKSLINTLSLEARSMNPGSTVMVDRLTEVLFIELMRHFMQEHAGQQLYLAALSDPQIGKALNLIHEETNATWTVERLGEHVGMSRTAFTDRFANLVGMPPKTYLINWRMQKAKGQLQAGGYTMIDISEAAGYSSEAAFSKAFKQFFGETPGRVKRHTAQ